MAEKRYCYCPRCGQTYINKTDEPKTCLVCKTTMIDLPPEQDFAYFINLDMYDENGNEIIGNSDKIFHLYVKDNPQFNRKLWELKNSHNEYVRNHMAPVKPNKPVPKCPICGSENLAKISSTKKAAKILAFGIFGMGDNGKTWRCKDCGSKF